MLPATPIVISPEGVYTFYFNKQETVLLCQKTLKVLNKEATPSAPCLWAQFCPASPDDATETLLVLERTRTVRYALPRMTVMAESPVAAAVAIPEEFRGTLHADVNRHNGRLNRVLYYDPAESALCYRKLSWTKEPFRFKGLNHERPVYSAAKNFLAFCRTPKDKSDANVVLVPQFDLKRARNFVTVARRKAMVRLCVHPNEDIVAAGDGLGRIMLIRYGTAKGKVVTQVFHWHSQPLLSLSWSKDGSYLYSGGTERVLIKWNIRENKKEAMAPRLADSLEHIVTNDHGVLALLGSSMLNRLNLELFGVCHVRLDIREDIAFGDQIFWHGKTSTLASLSKEGKIFFYDPKQGRCISELDIMESNVVTGDDEFKAKKKTKAPVVPRRLCVSNDGSCLAVYDNNAIRVFEFIDNTKNWKQRAVITQPHKGMVVREMTLFKQKQAHLQNYELVTSGEDGATRVWGSEAGRWGLRGTITYKQATPNSHALSVDRTVIACAHQKVISLWVTEDMTLRGTLSKGDDGVYTSMAFCSGRKAHILLAAKAQGNAVQIWDVLSFSCLLHFTAPDAVLRSSVLGNGFLLTSQGAYRVSSDFRVTRVHEGSSVESALEDGVGRPVIVLKDKSIKYDCSEAVEPGWKSFGTGVSDKFSGLKVDSRVNVEHIQREEMTSVRDFIPRRPLSHKLSEVLEELL